MKSSIVELAENLGINVNEVQPHKLAEQVCTRVLSNVYHAESAPITALEWNPGMTYMGIGAGQIETEIAEMLRTEMATADDLISICNRMDDVLKATEKLYLEIERFLPHKTYGTPHNNVTSAWRGGIGKMCSELHDTHDHFKGGIKSTTARIRAALKRIEVQRAAEQTEVLEKSGLHQQIGMEV